jgi:CBS domain-containing protein
LGGTMKEKLATTEISVPNPDEQSLKVFEIMSFPVVTAQEDDDIKSVALKMLKHKIGAVIITNKNGLEKGIITQGDIVRFFATSAQKDDLYALKAKELMSAPLICIGGDKELEVAADVMVRNKVKKLCVRDADRKLAGIITDNDIMKHSRYLIDTLIDMINTGYTESI